MRKWDNLKQSEDVRRCNTTMTMKYLPKFDSDLSYLPLTEENFKKINCW